MDELFLKAEIIDVKLESLNPLRKILGFENLRGYETRIYAYLAERYLSFWFRKYTRPIEWPWIFADFTKLK